MSCSDLGALLMELLEHEVDAGGWDERDAPESLESAYESGLVGWTGPEERRVWILTDKGLDYLGRRGLVVWDHGGAHGHPQ